MAVDSIGQAGKKRLKGALLVSAVVLVQVAWGTALVFLVVHFL